MTTNLTERVNKLTDEIGHLKRIENVINAVFGTLMISGLIAIIVISQLWK